MAQRVGVVAIQGDFAKHIEALKGVAPSTEIIEVRSAHDLKGVDRVIIPGGESTAVGMLMERFGLGKALQSRAGQGMPIWGTCMGMILMAKEVLNHEQYQLGLLDITVERNAFGAQVHSFEDEVPFTPFSKPLTGVFIRAPVVVKQGSDVETLSRYKGKIVAVRRGKLVATSFHPELTGDTRMHRWFLEL